MTENIFIPEIMNILMQQIKYVLWNPASNDFQNRLMFISTFNPNKNTCKCACVDFDLSTIRTTQIKSKKHSKTSHCVVFCLIFLLHLCFVCVKNWNDKWWVNRAGHAPPVLNLIIWIVPTTHICATKRTEWLRERNKFISNNAQHTTRVRCYLLHQLSEWNARYYYILKAKTNMHHCCSSNNNNNNNYQSIIEKEINAGENKREKRFKVRCLIEIQLKVRKGRGAAVVLCEDRERAFRRQQTSVSRDLNEFTSNSSATRETRKFLHFT